MCRSWFSKEEPVFNPACFRMMSFGKNTYPGGNSLPGCVNDTNFLSADIEHQFGGDIRKYTEWKATAKRYVQNTNAAISVLSPGATVAIIADSCFSGGILRANPHIPMHNGHPVYNRFLPNPDIKPGLVVENHFAIRSDLHWLVISACQEHQTAMDAYFSDIKTNMGALSYSLRKSLAKGMTWQEWVNAAMVLLAYHGFAQIPMFYGPLEKKHEIIGSSETLIIHNSSHGSQRRDLDGDEVDKLDETIELDTFVLDDTLNAMLQNIPKKLAS